MRLPSFTSIEQLLAITFACVIFKQPCIIMRLTRWILDFAHLVVFTALDVKPLSCSLPRLPFMEGDTHVKVEIFRYVRFRDFFLHWEVRLYLVGWERSILLLFGKLILFSDEKRVADFYMIGISLIIASFVEDLLTSHSFVLSIIDRLSLIKSAFFIRAIYTKHSRHFA